MATDTPISDPFCQRLSEDLRELDAALGGVLSRSERNDTIVLLAGVAVVMQFASGGRPPMGELNATLRLRLGLGFSWFSCVQFLSGARARHTFQQQLSRLANLVSPELLQFAEAALPSMGETVQAMMADGRQRKAHLGGP